MLGLGGNSEEVEYEGEKYVVESEKCSLGALTKRNKSRLTDQNWQVDLLVLQTLTIHAMTRKGSTP